MDQSVRVKPNKNSLDKIQNNTLRIHKINFTTTFTQSGNEIVSIKVEKVALMARKEKRSKSKIKFAIFCEDFSNQKYRDAMIII